MERSKELEETPAANGDGDALPAALSHDAALLAAVLSSDDEGSSGLSDIDINLDTDQLDEEAISLALDLHADGAFQPKRAVTADNDSEAETERGDESVDNDSTAGSIDNATTSAPTGSHGLTKPAKAVNKEGDRQDDAERADSEDEDDDDDGEEDDEETAESIATDGSPKWPSSSRAPTSIRGENEVGHDETRTSNPYTSNDLKRKRSESPDHNESKTSEEEPPRKRRSSIASRTDKHTGESQSEVPDSPFAKNDTATDNQLVDNAEEEKDTSLHARARRGKRSKRRTRSSRHNLNDRRNGSPSDESTTPENDGGNGDGDTPRDADAVLKSEAEAIRKKASALDALTSLEKQFMLMKDRVYDERIGNYQKEIDQLINQPEDHAEFQEYISMITENRRQKEEHEKLLLGFRIKSLCVKSEVDRLRIHSSYYQNVRDVREKHLDDIAAMHYRLTQDRFQSSKACPDYVIPFPTRRSQQIAQQAAYNKEVSILAGFAKYVGFPAAPEIMPAKPHERDEDLEKMGVRLERYAPPPSYPSSHHRYHRCYQVQQHL